MDIMEMTRELGKALQNDDRYIAYSLSKQACDNDEELQKQISSFDDLRSQLNTEIIKEDKDTDKIKELDQSIKDTYQKIMSNRNMVVFTGAQSALESLVSNINQIITLCANGEDPATCEPSTGCSGSCATCGGCG
ncbi:MAG: YlbF family regulator [Ruminococcus sp.]|nr:YlbF family regulator [Ruminococcus sp.]MBP8592991.1 YlbF family regulator [Ruminococcus sp.]MBQ3856598.1 YlbF family regulator [Ruminococcus sp.]MBQ8122360.1 YlbF family regulator [Ruminococcus sp.]HOO06177.1 YlbF family regulator [Ruminococcus sp.]